jgi:hypothetical protein
MAATLTADNGSVSGSSGLKWAGDSSGNLALQSGTGVTAMTLNSSQQASFVNNISAPNTFGFKNRIINGAMTIAQVNGTNSTTPSATNTAVYPIDRWQHFSNQASKITYQQQSSSPPPGFATYLTATVASAATTTSSDRAGLFQAIEGYNWYDMGWGTANAKTVTVSFWVQSSITGNFGGAVLNYAANYGYPFTYSIPSANTWTYITITIPGPTSGTWVGATNAGAMYLSLSFITGLYAATAGSWQSATIITATGATNFANNLGATYSITGVQIEAGTQATVFDYRPYTNELQLCQRYLPCFSGSGYQWVGYSYGSNQGLSYIPFPVSTRAAPTNVVYSALSGLSALNQANSGGAPTALIFDQASPNSADVLYTYSGLTNGSPCRLIQNSGYLYFTGCEL